MTPLEQVKKSIEDLDNLERKTERGMWWVRLGRSKSILLASQIALLESVVEALPDKCSGTQLE